MIWTICRQDAGESGRCLKAAFPQTGLDIKMHSSFTVMMTITMLKFRHETYDLFTYTKRRADFFCSLWKFPDLGYILQYMEDSRRIIFCSLFDELPPYNMFSNMWKIAPLQYFFAICGKFPPDNIFCIQWKILAFLVSVNCRQTGRLALASEWHISLEFLTLCVENIYDFRYLSSMIYNIYDIFEHIYWLTSECHTTPEFLTFCLLKIITTRKAKNGNFGAKKSTKRVSQWCKQYAKIALPQALFIL